EAVLVRLELRHEDPREHEADDADGEVDEEDPLPAEPVDEQAARERADEQGDARGRAPQAHGRAAAVWRERARDDGHRLRRHEGRAEALHRAEGDERAERAREAAAERGEREDREADEVDVLRPEPVAEAP